MPPTIFSLPAWTPGHYELENYARYVRHFGAWDRDRALRWDKLDKDTWRVVSTGAARVRVSFDHAAGGLEARHGALKGFAVAGEDRRFRWARAIIEQDSVLVWSQEVPRPVAVRYGWASNPVCNLLNSAGLPASPFRTDTWPGITQQP